MVTQLEQPLPAGGVCNLGALNLARYVSDDGVLLREELEHDAAVALHFLDNVIDATPYFTDLHVAMQKEGTRRTGLGTMGLADALIKLKVRYGSKESEKTIEEIYSIIRDSAYRESVRLAAEKGAFPRFDREQFLARPFIQALPEDIRDEIARFGIRNGVILTQAPTGTTSLLAKSSSGIEPIFDFATQRQDRTGTYVIYHELYQTWRDAYRAEVLANFPEVAGDDEKIDAILDEATPNYFVSAKMLTPEEHIIAQAAVQRYTDSSISKTANMPNEYTVDQIKDLYIKAYDLGCKGVTCYRDGSRDAVLTSAKPAKAPKKEAVAATETVAEGTSPMETTVTTSPVGSQPDDAPATAPVVAPVAPAAPAAPAWPAYVLNGALKKRPVETQGFTRNVEAPEGKVNITINSDEDGPIEVFVNVGRAGSDIAGLAEALGRLISLQLRMPSTMTQEETLAQVAKQLKGIGGSRSIGFGKNRISSLPDAVAQSILMHLDAHPHRAAGSPAPSTQVLSAVHPAEETPSAPVDPAALATNGNYCPQCGGQMVHVEGCEKCINFVIDQSCDFSRC